MKGEMLIRKDIGTRQLILCFLLLCCLSFHAFAFSWSEFWVPIDRQAYQKMQAGDFTKAAKLFDNPAWKASALYRQGDFAHAAQQFGTLNTASGHYNKGNALAKMQRFEEAIKAYDKALALNPKDLDALFNRQLVASLLQKQKKEQENKGQNKDKNQDKKNQGENKEQQSGQNQQKDQSQDPKDAKEQKDQKPGKPETSQKNQEPDMKKQDNDKKNQNKASSAKQKEDQKAKEDLLESMARQAREKQQAKEQWLRLILDDPGGLLREKFLRDHLRRQQGLLP